MTSLGSPRAVAICSSSLSAAGVSKRLCHRSLVRISINSCANGALNANSVSNEQCLDRNSKGTMNKLESLLYPDKVVAEEKIERPVGLPTKGRAILDYPRCNDCETKGLVVCATCTGSGLYIDSILECQGIFVKVRCLGCGGSGNILCSTCGGRGHL